MEELLNRIAVEAQKPQHFIDLARAVLNQCSDPRYFVALTYYLDTGNMRFLKTELSSTRAIMQEFNTDYINAVLILAWSEVDNQGKLAIQYGKTEIAWEM